MKRLPNTLAAFAFMDARNKRNRRVYAVVILLVIAAGLASRSSVAAHLPVFVATYGGDTLWALTVFLVLVFCLPRMGTLTAALVAVAIAFGVEVTQLYQADWINAVRATRFGALCLGVGFLWSDLVCYTAGIVTGAACEILGPAARRCAKRTGER